MLEPTNDIRTELARCALSPLYFILYYCWIYDNESAEWVRFDLWKEQRQALMLFHKEQKVLALKARQVGLSWLVLGYTAWEMIFKPIATVLIFSRRDDEATYLLSTDRLRGIYNRLPEWMKLPVTIDNAKTWGLSNGSTARAFPTSGGDSYSATLAIIDEADLVPNLNTMLRSIKPTVDSGGKLFLISRVDKSNPNSEFKRIYMDSKAGRNDWGSIFLPWQVRPSRDQAWYDALCNETLLRTGSLDEVHEQYPATDTEALAPASLDKRLPHQWLSQCYQEERGIEYVDLPPGSPTIPGLMVYRMPEKGVQYVGGCDAAEGLTTSDDSVTSVVRVDTGEEVALMVGKYTPAIHSAYSMMLMQWYNNGKLMIENNNHGHAMILWFDQNNQMAMLVSGHDKKVGWSSNALGKVLMYDAVAEFLKDQQMIIHDIRTWKQLGSIEKGTLKAPEGEPDDISTGQGLAQVARRYVIVVEYPKWGKIKAVYGR